MTVRSDRNDHVNTSSRALKCRATFLPLLVVVRIARLNFPVMVTAVADRYRSYGNWPVLSETTFSTPSHTRLSPVFILTVLFYSPCYSPTNLETRNLAIGATEYVTVV